MPPEDCKHGFHDRPCGLGHVRMGSINSMIMGPGLATTASTNPSRAIEGLDGLGEADRWPVQVEALATPARRPAVSRVGDLLSYIQALAGSPCQAVACSTARTVANAFSSRVFSR